MHTVPRFSLVVGLFGVGCADKHGDTCMCGDDSDDVELPDPSFNVRHSTTSVVLSITEGSGNYEFGMAETDPGDPDPWTGEDCLDGYSSDAGLYFAICHPTASTGVTLSGVDRVNDVVAGSTTFLVTVDSDVTTYYLISLSTGDCWAWGHDPSYYASQGCTEM